MARFVKKAVEVEAFKFDIDVEPPIWIRKEIERGNAWVEHSIDKEHTKMFIRTLEGLIYQVNIEDYIIQGAKGEIYPCKADIFEMTYEKVEYTATIENLTNYAENLEQGHRYIDKEKVKKNSLEFSAKLKLDTKDFDKNIENTTKEIETLDEAVDRLEKKLNRIFAKENKVDIDKIVKQLEERLRESIE
ncbi:hypothetical protein KWL13_007435 [Clostridioides difficile]|uniref:hypothetical protein n=1 Tax=Clostridioides difficile TaxID=1496 RepID=UPI000BC3EF8C|nr:hypothetical protein [Clostridioides difficile]MBH8089397.1 hypothetical protein [Clostridioides difficile]MBY1610014.1 hypothetical protein [Clostridioides difficile]MBY2078215.1 hypothetical protein [Clostridioides difficile]MBY2092577.1 hypothetical protein [Clostridioides difficile]MBY2465931.1 hypothetical protein [Clostridioides difficile]